MGNLTDDMSRLRGEVDALRSDRGALMQDLARGASALTKVVAAMRADFASAHSAMAKKTRHGREAFVADVISEVNTLLGDFSRARDDMAREGIHERGIFLTELRRQVSGMCKDTADDLTGARLAWRGQSPRKFRTVQLQKDPDLAAPLTPPMEETVKKTLAAPEFKAEKQSVTFKEPLNKEEKKKKRATPEFKMKKSPVTFIDPHEKEEKMKMVAALGAPAVKTSKVKIQSTVFTAPEAQTHKEKSRLDVKPAKTATKVKRGKK
jgi:hypothetical protein